MTGTADPFGRVHFLVFSDGTEPFASNAASFCAAALATGMDSATHYTRDQLQQDGFWEQFPTIPPEGPRAGFGAWKPFILRQHLASVGPDDVVIYHDAGSHRPDALPQLPRFPREVLELCARSKDRFIHGSALSWTPQEHLTKRDCLILLDAEDAAARRAPFISASPLVYMPSPQAFAFLDQWMALCTDPGLLTDQPDLEGAPNEVMRQHLHEEAIASILVHQHGAAHFDLAHAAPDLFETIRNRKKALRTPEAHLSVISRVLEQIADGPEPDMMSMAVRNLQIAEPVRAIRQKRPPGVVERELLRLGKGGNGVICRDHLQFVVGQNRILSAQLHALKDMTDLRDDFWRLATGYANMQLAELAVAGTVLRLPDMRNLIISAIRQALSDMPHLADEVIGACVWGRLDDGAREAFKAAHGSYRTESGNAAMTEFLARLEANDFPDAQLELSGDLTRFDAGLKRYLMDWLLLDHL